MHDARSFFFFFFNDTATTEIYTLSLHDALPISDEERVDGRAAVAEQDQPGVGAADFVWSRGPAAIDLVQVDADRKSTRLNSSHLVISYAVFCLKKKKKI